MESDIVEYLMLEEAYFGLPIPELQRLAYEFAKRNDINHNFGNRMAEEGSVR